MHWHEWTQTFWGWVFGWLEIKVPKEIAEIFSFLVFTPDCAVAAHDERRR
jgi:hypothetical protein